MALSRDSNKVSPEKIGASAYTKLFSNFDGTSSSKTASSRASRYSVSLRTTPSFQGLVETLPSGEYKQSAGSDLSNIFAPFRSVVASGEMPCFHNSVLPSGSASGTFGFFDLLPFQWDPTKTDSVLDRDVSPSGDALSGMVSGKQYYQDINKFRDVSDTRGIGLRLPLMGVGWGYTTDNQPWPSGSASGLFQGDVVKGYQVDPSNYIAAPIDLRYDKVRNVWTGGSGKNGFWAQIVGVASGSPDQPSGVATPSGTLLYSWTEYELGASGIMVPVANGRHGDKWSDPAFEVNANQTIPSGTFVWMFDKVRPDSYSFEYGNEKRTWIRIINSAPIADRFNAWQYGFVEQILAGQGRFTDKLAGKSTASLGVYAYNSIEANNSASGIQGNGIDISLLPPGVGLQPVRGNPVVLATEMPNCSGVTEFIFSHENMVQGTCE